MKYALLLTLSLFLVPVAKADLSVGLAKKYARVIYDVSLNGGGSVSHDLDAQLPAGAVITDLWVYINEAFTDSGTGSIALQCAGTRDLMDWQDITLYSVNQIYKARASSDSYTSASTSMLTAGSTATNAGIASVPSACNVTAVVRGDSGYVPLTDGKLTTLLEYFQP